MINSYEKEKFEVGKEYWTYYLETSNKGNSLKYYTGVFKTKLLSMNKNDYYGKPSEDTTFWYTNWDISALSKKGFRGNVHTYMNGYGSASCDFFDTYEDAAKAHDKWLKKTSKNLNTRDRENMLKKLVNKNDTPKVSSIERESISWYEKLTKKEKSYVKWIKVFYEKI